MEKSKRAPVLGIALALALQNLFIFWRHYFQGYAFPWDFLATYHAFSYYWIEAARQGASLDWIPFQGMGYPAYLNMQSGLFYPPLWLLVLFDHSYSLGAAVALQGLHVLFGAMGAVVCARLMGLSWRAGILAGVVFQGFGAFYSNSEHVDIVRAYALLPWLAAPVFARWMPSVALLKPIVLLQPLVIYAFWTGGYFGAVIATLLVLGVVLVVRMARERQAWPVGAMILGMQLAGCLIACVFLLPAALDVSAIGRSGQIGTHGYDYFTLKDIFALAFDVNAPFFGHDLSMRSVFIGLPAVALIIMGLPQARYWNPWILIAAGLALLVACGVLHPFLIKIFPPLGYSRFVLADYRGLIGLCVVLICAQAFDRLSLNDLASKKSLVGLMIFLAWVAAGTLLTGLFPEHKRAVMALVLVVLGLVVLVLVIGARYPKAFLPLLLLLAVSDWARVQWNQPYFGMAGGRLEMEREVGNLKDVRAGLVARLRSAEGCRPARLDVPWDRYDLKPWRGYYTGGYLMQDYSGPMQLLRQQEILRTPDLHAFMLEPWRAVAAEPSLARQPASDALRCVSYGIDTITYNVNTAAPQTVVENEVFSTGWSANIIDENGVLRDVLTPQNVSGLRGWVLPAGQYHMVATFNTPHWKLSLLIAFAGLCLWFGLWWRVRTTSVFWARPADSQ